MEFQWWSVIPFVLMLLSIAALPLIPQTSHHWEKLSTQLGVALVLGVPVALWMWLGGEHTTVLHALWEYAQFIILLGALFTISGGIFLAGDLKATPKTNTAFLAIGGLIASFIGTTGAAMLLIRPILNTNAQRTRRKHTVIFAIFIIANCGGLLTPLGDPPLFLGMLRGVPFTWTFNLFPMWFFVNAILLAIYFGIETRLYRSEPTVALMSDVRERTPLRVRGAINFAWLAAVVASVAFLPSIDLHAIETGHATAFQMIPWREVAMLLAAAASLTLGSKRARYTDNQFSWGPIGEVAALFIGIFLTMMPALKVLTAIAPKLPLNEWTLFIFTGGLSALLDNAPTYVTFFEMARTLPGEPRVADVPELYLISVSLGAVFCGAITYIGNGPNFMVKAVAENSGVTMPSFVGYIGWSVKYLIPTLAAMALIFIVQATWATAVGALIAAGLVGQAVMTARGGRAAQESIDAA
ncbi:MAG: sodium:proton antiporter [Ruaniaceae bacterium]|nr:sodium:proton antiporter [Ruaniaceae bacterium]